MSDQGQDLQGFPSHSDPGKCEFQQDNNNIWCEKLAGCQFECLLWSVPRNKPNPTKDDWRLEGAYNRSPGTVADPSRYYFCRCGEL